MLKGDAKAGADFQLAGHVFFLIAMWYLYSEPGGQFREAFSTGSPDSPVSMIIYLVPEWVFHFLGHYRSTQNHT